MKSGLLRDLIGILRIKWKVGTSSFFVLGFETCTYSVLEGDSLISHFIKFPLDLSNFLFLISNILNLLFISYRALNGFKVAMGRVMLN